MNTIPTNNINGNKSVIYKLGYWPEFCDARFLEFTFNRHISDKTSLSMLLHYIDTDKKLDLKIRITLSGISHMEFHCLSMENIADRIDLADSGKNGVKFEIESAYGLHGRCLCESADIELVSIEQVVTDL